MASRPTASIIIIGDEILKGQTKDTNSQFLSQELYKCGIKVSRISVIPDDVHVISEEVSTHSEKYSFVLTSGGIGPTHDDVTYEGVAEAFHEKLILHKDLQNALKNLCAGVGLDETSAFKMSNIPESAEVHFTSNSRTQSFIPIVSVKNVFIFPGIPSYLEYAFTQLKPLFSSNSSQYFNQNLYLNINEFNIADVLNMAVKEFEGSVKFGSYPEIDNKYYQVKVTIESDSEKTVTNAEAFLRSHLPHNSIVGQFSPNSDDALKLMYSVCKKKSHPSDRDFSKSFDKSLEVLKKCFDLYSVSEVCLSFNGGKDCTVLLHLTHLFLLKTYKKSSLKLKVLYVQGKHPFPEIEEFIQISVKRYNLDLITYQQPIKDALIELKKEHPDIKAILMGSRHTDPYCSSLKTFQMTDSDWPQFMRVNPLIHWTYPQVWKFLRSLDVPYCSLYDRGYTSLGCQHNTLQNAKLLASTKDSESYYLPAYLLQETEHEREGRTVNKDS